MKPESPTPSSHPTCFIGIACCSPASASSPWKASFKIRTTSSPSKPNACSRSSSPKPKPSRTTSTNLSPPESHRHRERKTTDFPAAVSINNQKSTIFSVSRCEIHPSLPRIAHSPNRNRPITTHQQRPNPRHRDPHRTPPYLPIRQHESSQKILILTRCMARLMQWHTNHLISHPHRLVPRSMLGRKNISVILVGKLIALIKRNFQRRIMRLQQHIGNNRPILQLRMLALVPRILMRPHIPPRPAIKSPIFNVRDVVRYQVVAQRIALVDRAPELSRLRIYRNPASGIANPIRVYLQLAIRRIARQNVGPIFLRRMSVSIVDIRSRTYAHKHFLPIRRKRNRTSPMSAPGWQIGDVLRFSARLQISIVIWEANHFVRVANVDPLRFRPRRIKRNPVRTFETLRENFRPFRLTIRSYSPIHANASRIALRQKDVAVRSGLQPSRIIQPRRIQLYLEPRGRHRPRVLRTRHHLRTILRRISRIRLWQILYRNLARRAWHLIAKIREWRVRSCTPHPRPCNFRLRSRRWTGGCLARIGRLARSHRFHISHNLPALLFRQRRPRRHAVILISLGDEPENLTCSDALQFPVNQRRHIARTLSHFSVTSQTITRIDLLPGIYRSRLSCIRILHSFRRRRRIMKRLIGRPRRG